MRIEDILQHALDDIQIEIASLRASNEHYKPMPGGGYSQSARLLYTTNIGTRIETMRKAATNILKNSSVETLS